MVEFRWIMHHIFFIHSSVDGHLDCFHVLATMHSAAMNIWVHISFQILVLSGYVPRNGIAGSYGNSLMAFSLNSFLIVDFPQWKDPRKLVSIFSFLICKLKENLCHSHCKIFLSIGDFMLAKIPGKSIHVEWQYLEILDFTVSLSLDHF